MSSILLLGATSDVATAVAAKYASKGHDIILAGRRSDELIPLKSDLEIRFGVKAMVIPFDAENTNRHTDFCNQLNPFPEKVVCVFGYLGNQNKAESDWDEANHIIQVNYVGALSILSQIANRYELQKSGTIIGISSVAGERGRQSNYFYGSAKAGFTAYLSGLRNRLAKSGVHVLTVKPGFIDTKMVAGVLTPKILTATPRQVAEAIFNADKKQKNIIYILSVWRIIMIVIKLIPESIFKKLKL